MARWLWQLKWVLVIAIFAGPVISYFSRNDELHIQRIMAQGAAFQASVRGVRVEHHPRGGDDYYLQLTWPDGNGVPHNDELKISDAYADQISGGGTTTIDRVTIKYLASEIPSMIVVEDAAEELRDARLSFRFGIVAAIAGLIISPILFWLERQQQKKLESEIDAIVAESQAREAQRRSGAT